MVHFSGNALTESRDGHTLLYTHQDLCVAALFGTAQHPLASLDTLVSSFNLELGPVKREPGRFFRAGFGYPPPLDFTATSLSSASPAETSLMIISLDMPATRTLLHDAATHLALTSFSPPPDYAAHIKQSAIIELATYLTLRKETTHTGNSLLTLFSITHYANFLNLYKGVPPHEALQQAVARFRIPL